MLERLVGGDPLVGIELEESTDEIEALLAAAAGQHEVLEALLLGGRGALDHARTVVRLDAVDVHLARTRYVLEYALELIERGRAGKDGRADEHLAEYAAHAPHVHALGVLGRGEQDLGRPVPARRHVLGERRIGVLVVVRLVRERTRQAEVAQLHVTLLVEQYVRRLLVSVYHVRRVQVLGRLEQLIHDVLLVHVLQYGLSLDHVVQVGFYCGVKSNKQHSAMSNIYMVHKCNEIYPYARKRDKCRDRCRP